MKEIPVCSRCGTELEKIMLRANAHNTMKFDKAKGQYEDPLKLNNWKIQIGLFECPNCHLQKRFIQDLAISPEEWMRRQRKLLSRPRPPKVGEPKSKCSEHKRPRALNR